MVSGFDGIIQKVVYTGDMETGVKESIHLRFHI